MTNRERIILAVTAMAMIVGTVYFIIDRGSKVTTGAARSDLKALQDFASLTDEKMNKAAPTETQAYILGQASVEWESDPFLENKLTVAKPEAAKAGEIPTSLAYTGFVIAGQAKLAVINGMEYQVGEVVLGSGLVVQAIDPQSVTVQRLEGRGESFNIPFTGEVLR
jgi:hypothetical protein